MPGFRWNDWNRDHATKHGVAVAEAEAVIRAARSPYPLYRGDGKWFVVGQGTGGRFVQVIYLKDPDGTLYIIHARPITPAEKRRFRRRAR